MNFLEQILSIQATIALICLTIQLYAFFSSKWGLFESRIELGIIEEHGYYGLWSLCTYRMLVPAEVDDEGHVIINADCDPLNTFFRPGHSRALIAFFAFCHSMAMLAYALLVSYRLGELFYRQNTIETDLEVNESSAKRLLMNITRIFSKNHDQIMEEDYIKKQIRLKLYVISVAVMTTLFALLSAISPRKTLRETDMFQIANVSENNYRVWRGPGFWAQLTTMIMDMIITCLIVIEVRVLFVLHRQLIEQDISTSSIQNSPIVPDTPDHNPFFPTNDVNPPPALPPPSTSMENNVNSRLNDNQQTMILMEETRPKTIDNNSFTSNISNQQQQANNHYVDSNQVRELKRSRHNKFIEDILQGTSYCNPMFCEDNNYETIMMD